MKVRGKVFVFLGRPEDGGLGLSVKLPGSATSPSTCRSRPPPATASARAAGSPLASPRGEKPPVELLKQWIDESYRAVAPKRLVAQLP